MIDIVSIVCIIKMFRKTKQKVYDEYPVEQTRNVF